MSARPFTSDLFVSPGNRPRTDGLLAIRLSLLNPLVNHWTMGVSGLGSGPIFLVDPQLQCVIAIELNKGQCLSLSEAHVQWSEITIRFAKGVRALFDCPLPANRQAAANVEIQDHILIAMLLFESLGEPGLVLRKLGLDSEKLCSMAKTFELEG